MCTCVRGARACMYVRERLYVRVIVGVRVGALAGVGARTCVHAFERRICLCVPEHACVCACLCP